ncbi:MAG: hypothetical protein K2M99_02840, partial [Treponemataceae bacterium]|nr:hypothetical protein [Treponemataceae bacterium]
ALGIGTGAKRNSPRGEVVGESRSRESPTCKRGKNCPFCRERLYSHLFTHLACLRCSIVKENPENFAL